MKRRSASNGSLYRRGGGRGHQRRIRASWRRTGTARKCTAIPDDGDRTAIEIGIPNRTGTDPHKRELLLSPARHKSTGSLAATDLLCYVIAQPTLDHAMDNGNACPTTIQLYHLIGKCQAVFQAPGEKAGRSGCPQSFGFVNHPSSTFSTTSASHGPTFSMLSRPLRLMCR